MTGSRDEESVLQSYEPLLRDLQVVENGLVFRQLEWQLAASLVGSNDAV